MNKRGREKFGIDHPLVTVLDHKQTLKNYQKLGFYLSPVSYHPWGTVTSLVMFADNFIELISIHDKSKFHMNEGSTFCFGENVNQFLEREEGVSLLALYSNDIESDYQQLLDKGLQTQGRIDFRRAIKTPEGMDEAVVSLGLFIDKDQPNLSNFICQQHKPELIWVPEWQQHPNKVNAITKIVYVGCIVTMQKRWMAIYGDKVQMNTDEVSIDTGAGYLIGMSEQHFKTVYPNIPLPIWNDDTIHAVLIQLKTESLENVKNIVQSEQITSYIDQYHVVIFPEFTGNIILEFVEQNNL